MISVWLLAVCCMLFALFGCGCISVGAGNDSWFTRFDGLVLGLGGLVDFGVLGCLYNFL